MVKQQKKNNRKKRSSKGFTANSAKARKINASTEYETCDEQLSPYGGLLAISREAARDTIEKTVVKRAIGLFFANIKNNLPGCIQSC
jgi:hypothetical protein